MTSPDRLGLRTEAPRLEPDEAFLQRLSQLAAASAPAAAGPRVARSGLAIGLAAASVTAVVGGVAWAGGVIGDSDPDPRRPAPAETGGPGTETPSPDSSGDASPLTPGGRQDAGDREGERATGARGERGDRDADGPRGDAPGASETPDADPGTAPDTGANGSSKGQGSGQAPGTHPGNPNPGTPPTTPPGNPNPGTPQGHGHGWGQGQGHGQGHGQGQGLALGHSQGQGHGGPHAGQDDAHRDDESQGGDQDQD